jgi:hypothetical protein
MGGNWPVKSLLNLPACECFFGLQPSHQHGEFPSLGLLTNGISFLSSTYTGISFLWSSNQRLPFVILHWVYFLPSSVTGIYFSSSSVTGISSTGISFSSLSYTEISFLGHPVTGIHSLGSLTNRIFFPRSSHHWYFLSLVIYLPSYLLFVIQSLGFPFLGYLTNEISLRWLTHHLELFPI